MFRRTFSRFLAVQCLVASPCHGAPALLRPAIGSLPFCCTSSCASVSVLRAPQMRFLATAAPAPREKKSSATKKTSAAAKKKITSEFVPPVPFVASWNAEQDDPKKLASEILIYCPSNQTSKVFPVAEFASSAIPWIQKTFAEISPSLHNEAAVPALFPLQRDATSSHLMQSNLQSASPILIGVECWTTVAGLFAEEVAKVNGMPMPSSLEEAFYAIQHRIFPTTEGESGLLRSAKLAWETAVEAHERIGTGSKTPAIEQIVRRTEKKVQVIVMDVNLQAAQTVSSPHTVTATILDVTARKKAVQLTFKNLSDPAIANVANLISSSDAISLIFATGGTKPTDFSAFQRALTVKGPVCLLQDAKQLLDCFEPSKKNIFLNSSLLPRSPTEFWRAFTKATDTEKDEKSLMDACGRYARKWYAPRRSMGAVQPQKIGGLDRVKKASSNSVEDGVVPNIDLYIGAPKQKLSTVEMLQAWYRELYCSADRLHREQAAAKRLEKYLVIDLETTTVNKYKRVANPFIEENHVVLPGLRDYKGRTTIPPQYLNTKAEMKLPSLDDYDVIVGHNIKFDLLHMWQDPNLKRFFKRGGRIWDTMVAEYFLSGHVVRVGTGAGLDAVSASYGGTIHKLDEVKDAWAKGLDTTQIPHKTLAKYLEGDLLNTELIFKAQIPRAIEQRQLVSMDLKMDSILCTTEMEFNGLFINRQLALEQEKHLLVETAELKKSLQGYIPQQIPESVRKHFNWGSLKHLGALFFGEPFTLETYVSSYYMPKWCKPQAEVNENVVLQPPIDITVPTECLFVNGFVGAAATKAFRRYFDPYLRENGFRKTTVFEEVFDEKEILDKCAMLVCCVRCVDPKAAKGAPSPAPQLYPPTAPEGSTIVEVAVQNAVTGAVFQTFVKTKRTDLDSADAEACKSAPDESGVAAKLWSFIGEQCHTSSPSHAGHVVLLGRHSATFTQPLMQSLLRAAPAPANLSITYADATSVLDCCIDNGLAGGTDIAELAIVPQPKKKASKPIVGEDAQRGSSSS